MKRITITILGLYIAFVSVALSYDPSPQQVFLDKLTTKEIVEKFEQTIRTTQSQEAKDENFDETISRCLGYFRKESKPEFIPLLKQTIENSELDEHHRQRAVKIHYLISGDKDYLRELIKGSDDAVIAQALDSIAWDITEQELGAIIDKLTGKKDSLDLKMSGDVDGFTGSVISRMRHVRRMNEFYHREKDPHKKMQLLMDFISSIEHDDSMIKFKSILNEDVEGRFWLSKHREVFEEDRAAYLKAMSFHLNDKPYRKRRTVVMVLGQLGMTDEEINALFPKQEEPNPIATNQTN